MAVNRLAATIDRLKNRDRPFVVFDDARVDGADGCRVYSAPIDIISAASPSAVAPALERLRETQQRGLHAAGWMSYEAGLALEPRLQPRAERRAAKLPLLWFGVFEGYEALTSAELSSMLPDRAGAWVTTPTPRLSQEHYRRAIARVMGYIVSGDVYQLNLTFQTDVEVLGDALSLYAQIRTAGQGRWSGVAYDGQRWLLSTSPELFFALRNNVVEARPMKGTYPRADDAERDRLAALALQNDPKQRAENLMIVDLLRNDLSRVAKVGTVIVPDLFTVETYPTLHTLTSTIRAELAETRDAVDLLKALFPCGSITGAPKIRAMEIIDDLEPDPRGAYTGTLGWIDPSGDAAFNVLIRTLALTDGDTKATLGVGSGVVLDSDPDSEWAECLVKSSFLTKQRPSFDLMETMCFEPEGGIRDLALHLQRLERSAKDLGFAYVAAAVDDALSAATRGLLGAARVRLCLSMDGETRVDLDPAPAPPDGEVLVALAPLPVDPRDVRLRYKTTQRQFYDEARQRAGAFEVIFVDPVGRLTEGSFTNLFAPRGQHLLTPPSALGLLPGVLRQKLLAQGVAVEAELTATDLTAGFFIGNSLRGLMKARLKSNSMAADISR